MSKGEVTARRNKCNFEFERLVIEVEKPIPKKDKVCCVFRWDTFHNVGSDTQGIQCPAYLYLTSIGNVKNLRIHNI